VENEDRVLSVMYLPIGDAVTDPLAYGLVSAVVAKLGRTPRPMASGSVHLILERFQTTRLAISPK
jgi:hypothetical protein